MAAGTCQGSAAWIGDLKPIGAGDWTAARAKHLMERAGFGETPEKLAALASGDPAKIVRDLVAPQESTTRTSRHSMNRAFSIRRSIPFRRAAPPRPTSPRKRAHRSASK